MSAARELFLGMEEDVNNLPRAARLLQAALTSGEIEPDPEAVLWAVGEIIAMSDRVLAAYGAVEAATSPEGEPPGEPAENVTRLDFGPRPQPDLSA